MVATLLLVSYRANNWRREGRRSTSLRTAMSVAWAGGSPRDNSSTLHIITEVSHPACVSVCGGGLVILLVGWWGVVMVLGVGGSGEWWCRQRWCEERWCEEWWCEEWGWWGVVNVMSTNDPPANGLVGPTRLVCGAQVGVWWVVIHWHRLVCGGW